MDPITAAILGALATGFIKGVTNVGVKVVEDAYSALKTMLLNKYGGDEKLVKAIKGVEKKPNSQAKKQALNDVMKMHPAKEDPELIYLASELRTVTNHYIRMKAGDNAVQIVGNGNIGRIQGNQVIVTQGPIAPSAYDLLQQGVQLFRAGSYQESIAPLNQSLLGRPSPDANYYLALASLRGQRPRELTYTQAKAIEGRLNAACRLDPNKAHYWYLWAMVKYDYFFENGFLDDVDEVNELLTTGDNCPLERAFLVEMLDHVPATNSPVYEVIQDRL